MIALVETIATRLDPNIKSTSGSTSNLVELSRLFSRARGKRWESDRQRPPLWRAADHDLLESESGEAQPRRRRRRQRHHERSSEQRLFLPGSRSEDSSAASPDRAGLGFVTAGNLLREIGGDVRHVAGCSRFEVVLPRRVSEPADAATSRATTDRLRRVAACRRSRRARRSPRRYGASNLSGRGRPRWHGRQVCVCCPISLKQRSTRLCSHLG